MTQRDLALVIDTGERFIVELEAGKRSSHLGKALAAAQAVGVRILEPLAEAQEQRVERSAPRAEGSGA